jgi:PAS domain-containing protein
MKEKEMILAIQDKAQSILANVDNSDINNNSAEFIDNLKEGLSEILTSLTSLDELINNNIDFQEVVENLDDSIFITNSEGRVLYVNPAYVKNTGIQPEEVLDRLVADILDEGKLFR